MEGQTNTLINTAGINTMDPGGLARQDPQTTICPMCGSPGHNDSTHQLHKEKALHFCLQCKECFITVPNTKSKKGQMTDFYSVKIKKLDQLKEVGYQCIVCNKMFGNLLDRNAHMGKHMGVNTHICTKCGFVSNYKSAIDAHMVTHTKQYSHKCPVCCKWFATSRDMDQHLKMHLGDSLHRCQQCSFASPDAQAQIMNVSLVQSEAEDHAGMQMQNINISITYSYLSEHKDEHDTRSDRNHHEQGKSPSVGKSSEVYHVHSMSNQPRMAALQTLPLLGNFKILVDKGVATHPGLARTLPRGTGRKPPIPICTASSTQDKAIIHKASVYVPGHTTVHALHKPTKRIIKSQGSADMLTLPRPHRCSVCGKSFAHVLNLEMHITSHRSKSQMGVETYENCEEEKKNEADKNCEEDGNCRADNTHETCKKHEADKDHQTDEKCDNNNYQQPGRSHQANKNQEAIKGHEADKNYETDQNDETDKHQAGLYRCHIRSVKFKQKGWLKEHMEIHSPCSFCKSVFPSPEKLNKHILTHTVRNKVKCMICFKWFSDLPEHMETHPIRDFTETPQDKVKGYVPEDSIQSAVCRESIDTWKPHKCTVCGKEFAKRVYLLIHKQCHKPQKACVCSLCGHATTNRGNFTKHMHRHTLDNQHQCSDCGKTFTTQFALKFHVQVKHADGDTSMQCAICWKEFANITYLKKHMSACHSEKKYACLYCNQHFAVKCRLNAHIKQLHQGKGDYKCSVCGKCWSTPRRLREHERVHTGEKPFMCSLCCKQFSTNYRLNEHMLTHTGEKPHMCAICGKTYASSLSLSDHMRYHTRKTHMKKTHECSECGRMTYSAAQLKIHMASHREERPYSCNECGRSFKTKPSLQKHSHKHQMSGHQKKRRKKKKKTEYKELTETVTEQPGVSSFDQPFIPLYLCVNPEPYTCTAEVVSNN